MFSWASALSGLLGAVGKFLDYIKRREIRKAERDAIANKTLKKRLENINRAKNALDRLRSDPEFRNELRKRADVAGQ